MSHKINPSFSKRLTDLGNEAFAAARAKLAGLPEKKLVLRKPITLYVDPCDETESLFRLDARTVVLTDDVMEVFAEDFDFARLEKPDGYDDLEPYEYWCQGGAWYAEWEGLFDLIDTILAYEP